MSREEICICRGSAMMKGYLVIEKYQGKIVEGVNVVESIVKIEGHYISTIC